MKELLLQNLVISFTWNCTVLLRVLTYDVLHLPAAAKMRARS